MDGEATDQVGGWDLFVGHGPHFEFWEGSEADYEQTEQIIRAAVQGKCRSWWSREEVRDILRPWRRHHFWEHHTEIALPDGLLHATYAGGSVSPEEAGPREVQAAPY